MTMSKTYKGITFTAIISLTLFATSSSVKAATFTTVDMGDAGVLTINSSNLTHNIVTRSQGQGAGILNAEEPIVINNNTFNNNLVPPPTAGGTITISSISGLVLTPTSPSVSIEGGSILNPGEAIVINNNTFNNNSVPHPTAGGTITISSGTITATKIPEPASPISFAILGMGSFLLRLNKIRQKKRV